MRQYASMLTQSDLEQGLKDLGVTRDMTLLVHCSIKAFESWICGGPVALLLALQHVLGPGGNLIMPSQSAFLSEPSHWRHPPVPEDWWPHIRAEMPAYDPDLTPTLMMGALAETFRKQKEVLRSLHPQLSFVAKGPNAAQIIENHSLERGLGEQSPLARLYDLGAHVLLLGVDHSASTSMHLAEFRAHFEKPWRTEGAPVIRQGHREWVLFQDLSYEDRDFQRIGQDFEDAHPVKTSLQKIGNAKCRLFSHVDIVDFAVDWMNRNR